MAVPAKKPAKKQPARCTTVKRKAAAAGKKPTKAALKKAGCATPKAKKPAKAASKARKSRQLIPVRQDQIISARDFFRRQGMKEGVDFFYSEFKA